MDTESLRDVVHVHEELQRVLRDLEVVANPGVHRRTRAHLPLVLRVQLNCATDDGRVVYSRPPIPSLHSLDSAGRVIYVGSMSKVLFPSLRIGYFVLPPALVDRFAALRSVVDDHGPLVDQATLAAFIDGGAFYTHIRRSRRAYGERQHVFLETARRTGLPLTFSHTDGGMNLVGNLPAGTDDGRMSRRLEEAGFDVPALSAYALRRPASGLVFGYTAFEPAVLRREVSRLARAMRQGV